MLSRTLSQEQHYEIIQITNQAIKVTFKGFLKIKDLVSLSAFMDNFSKNNRIDLFLVDQSDLKVLSREVQIHLAKTISTVNKDFKKIAIIEAEDIFAKAAFDKLRREAENDEVTRAVFHSEKTALEWLLSSSANPNLPAP